MDAMVPFEHLVLKELDSGKTFTEALLTGYGHFSAPICSCISENRGQEMIIFPLRTGFTFSHGLTSDLELSQLARDRKLRDEKTLRAQTSRLIASMTLRLFATSPMAGQTCLSCVEIN